MKSKAYLSSLAQRRRRVFVVANAHDWRRAAGVLFERQSLFGDYKTSKEARAGFAAAAGRGTRASGESSEIGKPVEPGDGGTIPSFAYGQEDGSSCLNPWETQSGRVFAHDGVFPSLVGGGKGNRGYAGGCVLDGRPQEEQQRDPVLVLNDQGGSRMDVSSDVVPTIRANSKGNEPCVCVKSYAESSFSQFKEGEVGTLRASGGCLGGGSETLVVECPNAEPETAKRPIEPSTLVVRCGCEGGGKGALISEGLSMTLSTANHQTLFQPSENSMVVRRLTPIECERLQGFPDNWTQVEWNGKPAEECPKGRRYKAIGNSMAVPVMRWIAEGLVL